MKTVVYALLALLAAVIWLLPAQAEEPPRGSALRSQILDALRLRVETDLKLPVRFKINRINAEGPWAFVSATPLGSKTETFDWSKTPYAKDMAGDFMSDVILALLRNDGNGWRITEYALGPTDVAWEEWISKHKLPRRLFDPAAGGAEAAPNSEAGASKQSATQTPGDWRQWELGDLTLSLPPAWQALSEQSVLNLKAKNWDGMAFAENMRAVEKGALLTLAWSGDHEGYAKSLDHDNIDGAGMISFGGRQGSRVDFTVQDAFNATRGFDASIEDPASKLFLVVTCRGPIAHWLRIEKQCLRVLDSITLKWPDTLISTAEPGAEASSPSASTPQAEPAGGSEPAPDSWLSPKDRVLFSGTLGDVWSKYSAAGGNYDSFATLTDGALVVDVPAGNRQGKTGIVSREPVVWLDEFGDGASSTTTFTFDPKRTSSFAIALSQASDMANTYPDPWGLEGMYLHWQPKPDGQGATLHVWDHSKITTGEQHIDMAAAQPGEMRLIVTPGKLKIETDTGQPVEVAFGMAVAGAGFYLHIHAAAPAPELATKMALTRITTRRTPAVASPASAGPAPDVTPLPVTRVFGGTLEGWEAFGFDGGDFAKYARLENGIAISTPENAGWARTGVVSKNPLLRLDNLTTESPHLLEFTFDPANTGGVMVQVAPDKAAFTDRAAAAWVTIHRIADRRWRLATVNADYGTFQAREFTGAWDGRLQITLHAGKRFSVALPGGGPMMSHFSDWVSERRSFWVSVMSRPREINQPANMKLRSVDVTRIAPPGMTAEQRWLLVDDKDFNANDFLNDLASSAATVTTSASGTPAAPANPPSDKGQ